VARRQAAQDPNGPRPRDRRVYRRRQSPHLAPPARIPGPRSLQDHGRADRQHRLFRRGRPRAHRRRSAAERGRGRRLPAVQVYGILPGSVYYARYDYNLRKLQEIHLDPSFEHRSIWLQKLGAEKRAEIQRQLDAGTAAIAAHDTEDAAHGDQAIGAVLAIANDTRTIETVNVVNHGTVPNLPDEAIVEKVIEELFEAHRRWLPQFYPNG